MLRKEILDTLRQTLFVLVFLVVLPLIYAVDGILYGGEIRFPWYFVNGFGLLTIMFAFYLGLNSFQRERRDGAWEYLLSLPVRKGSLFWSKFLPRLVVLALFVCINELLIGWDWEGGPGLYIHPLRSGIPINLSRLAMVLLFGFIISVLGKKSWRSVIVLSVIAAGRMGLYGASIFSVWFHIWWAKCSEEIIWIRIPQESRRFFEFIPEYSPIKMGLVSFVEKFNFYLDWLLLTALVVLAFIPVFRSMTIVRTRAQENRFLRIALIPFILVALTIVCKQSGIMDWIRYQIAGVPWPAEWPILR